MPWEFSKVNVLLILAQHVLNTGEWIDVDMIVQFRDNYDEELRGKEGTVRSIVRAVSKLLWYTFFAYQVTVVDNDSEFS